MIQNIEFNTINMNSLISFYLIFPSICGFWKVNKKRGVSAQINIWKFSFFKFLILLVIFAEKRKFVEFCISDAIYSNEEGRKGKSWNLLGSPPAVNAASFMKRFVLSALLKHSSQPCLGKYWSKWFESR